MKSRTGPRSPEIMQMREANQDIFKRCNEGTKEIALTQTELKNRDHKMEAFLGSRSKRGPKYGKVF